MGVSRLCPVCGGVEYTVIFSDRNRRGDYTCEFEDCYVRCSACSHIYLVRPPDQMQLHAVYNDMECPEQSRDGMFNMVITEVDRTLSRFTDRAKYYHSLPFGHGMLKKRLLDIGCNNGAKLNQFRNRGWDIYGVDISRPAIEAAKKRIPGGKFSCGSVEDVKYPDNFFDCVRMDNVLEHLQNPVRTLAEVYRIMKLAGEFYFYVPNGDGFCTKIFKRYSINSWIPFHLNLFTKKSAMAAFERAGFNTNLLSIKFSTPLSWLYLSLKQTILGSTGNQMTAAEKLLAGLLVPAASLLSRTESAEELVICGIK